MKLFLLTAAFFYALTARALPLPHNDLLPDFPSTFISNYDFEGLVSLPGCSGSLIQLENAKDSDKALVLTNGHCYEGGLLSAGQVLANQPSTQIFQVLNSKGSVLGQLTATTLLYSTMTKTDISLYQVQETYSDIKAKYGVRPLSLSSQRPKLATPIEVISGRWKRGYSCNLEKFIDTVKEDSWIWNDSIRYSRPGCEVVGGTSGSPILVAGTRQIIGINNTVNENGNECDFNNPCEIDSTGKVFAERGYGYGQQTYWIYSCLNSDRQFDLSVKDCLLPH